VIGFRIICGGAALLAAGPGAVHAQGSAAAVLARAQTAYDQTTTLRAQFRQMIDNPMLGEPEPSYGTLYLSPPDRFAMRFSDPEGDRIVADGEWLWLYTPSTTPNQVIKQPVPSAGAATPNLFAQFVDRPLERYAASYVGSETVDGVRTDRVRLVPRVEGLPFREATISVSQANGSLKKLDLVEESGQRRTLVFLSLETNIPIPARELIFRPPAGVRIVEP
jgi:outer membrane lipoprotein carrier protein